MTLRIGARVILMTMLCINRSLQGSVDLDLFKCDPFLSMLVKMRINCFCLGSDLD